MVFDRRLASDMARVPDGVGVRQGRVVKYICLLASTAGMTRRLGGNRGA